MIYSDVNPESSRNVRFVSRSQACNNEHDTNTHGLILYYVHLIFTIYNASCDPKLMLGIKFSKVR